MSRGKRPFRLARIGFETGTDLNGANIAHGHTDTTMATQTSTVLGSTYTGIGGKQQMRTPVKTPNREGAHIGDAVYARVNVTPSERILSMYGVDTRVGVVFCSK